MKEMVVADSDKNIVLRVYDKIVDLMVKIDFPMVGNSKACPG